MNEKQPKRGILYLISCRCSSASLTHNVVAHAQAVEWEVCVITTPKGKAS